MDTLVLYQKITEIKANSLVLPFLKPSATKVQFNLKELDLHYFSEFGAYVSAEQLEEFAKKKGGVEDRIVVIETNILNDIF